MLKMATEDMEGIGRPVSKTMVGAIMSFQELASATSAIFI